MEVAALKIDVICASAAFDAAVALVDDAAAAHVADAAVALVDAAAAVVEENTGWAFVVVTVHKAS